MAGDGWVALVSRAKKGVEHGIVRQLAWRDTAMIFGDCADPKGRDAAQSPLGGAVVRQPDVTDQRSGDRLANGAKGGFLRDRRRTPW
jgi:hypothetical protein